MPDVFAVADRVAVLRRGRKVAEKPVTQSSPEEVTGLITGAIQCRLSTEAGATHPDIGDIRIQDVVSIKEQTAFERLISSQPFWVTVALAHHRRGDELPAAAGLRLDGELLQYHPQFRLYRHHGGRHGRR